MQKDGLEKTLEEIFRERADVLYRTGESLSRALKKLDAIAKVIDNNMECIKTFHGEEKSGNIEKLYTETNKAISKHNRAREYARLRYHYLIITREAMGFRRHKWVEETYRIPPKIKHLDMAYAQIQQTENPDDQ